MGSSRLWQDVIRQMTRGRVNRIDAGAMLKYFEPLNEWLKRQNEMQSVIGWITNRDDRGLIKININFLALQIYYSMKVQNVSCENRNLSFCFSIVCRMVSK